MATIFLGIWLICLTNPIDASENVFYIDKPLIKVVEAAKENIQSYEQSELDLNDLGVLKKVDLFVNAQARPKYSWYRFDISLMEGVSKLWSFNKTLEIQGLGNRTRVTSTVYIGYGRTPRLRVIRCLKDKILNVVEHKLLSIEERKLRELSQ